MVDHIVEGAGGNRRRVFHTRLLEVTTLVLIVIVAFALRVGCALYFKNINYPDEIFQYIEPAHHAVFGYGLIAPEFELGFRSWIVPGLVAGIMKAASFWSDDAAIYLLAVHMTMAAMSLTVVVAGFLWGQRFFGLLGAVITGCLLATWIELIYFAPKTLTDVLATDALVLAVFVVYPEIEQRTRAAFFWCGLLLGVGFVIRWQLTLIYFVVALYVCQGRVRDRWLPLITGGIAPLLASGLIDALTWGYPFHSILAVIPLYSVPHPDPWYYYFGVLILNWTGAVVPLLLFALLGARRLPFFLVLATAVVVFYSAIGIKIYRYIYPMLPFFLILVGIGTSEAVVWLKKAPRLRSLPLATIAVSGWAMTSAALAVSDHYRVYLNKDAALVDDFEKLRKRSDLCGLGIVEIPWWNLPGYTYLHRDVPMYSIALDQIQAQAKSFNYLIGPSDLADNQNNFVRQNCSTNIQYFGQPNQEICIYRRPGDCVQSSEHTVQSTIPRNMLQ